MRTNKTFGLSGVSRGTESSGRTHFLEDHIAMFDSLSTLNQLPLPDKIKLIATVIGACLAMIGILAAIFTKIIPYLKNVYTQRTLLNKLKGNWYTKEIIANSLRYYIIPDCQSLDPSGGDEPSKVMGTRQNVFQKIDEALRSPTQFRYIIILADSGMGKSSFLLNYYGKNIHFNKRRLCIALVPLGTSNADDKISSISDKENTVLFLDALDEDANAIIDHSQRINELVKLTKDFPKVVITCRTQFFPKDEEIPKEALGIIKTGPRPLNEPGFHYFHKLYLSPFNEEQIKRFLKKRFPIWKKGKRQKAQDLVRRVENLMVRPMLLAYINDLLDKDIGSTYACDAYEELINAWLHREEGIFKEIRSEGLRKFSDKLAVDLILKRKERRAEKISREDIESLSKEWNIDMSSWHLSGRSLLNRDAIGNFKFAHRSFMEYLVAKQLFEGSLKIESPLFTDQIDIFLAEMYKKAGMATVPAGKFLYGDQKIEKLIEKPFLIGLNLVTNEEYGKFKNDNGYLIDSYWTVAGKKWLEKNTEKMPGFWKEAKWNKPSLPVVGVTWYEATAYCNWMTEKHGAGKYLFCLPTEEMWEYAARGTDGREYPWGDKFYKDKCNTSESKKGQTTDVNTYNNGVSPFGCHDMAGNVWEWTKTDYDTENEKDDFELNEYPVLRGGSWLNTSTNCRCAARHNSKPDYRDTDIGFRCSRITL